jgi:UDP-2,4-diacetamido-2,4,6-trideoxy-beta-L-altropyranose hydrolase
LAELRELKTLPIAMFRCDASPSIGAGHVSRCLALAEALHEAGWDISFVVREETIAIVPALAAGGFKVHALAKDECEVAAMCPPGSQKVDLVVVDHYEHDHEFESKCRVFGSKILAFDDATDRDHDCDILVDSGAADATIYAGHVPYHALVVAGPAYALMRQSFIRSREVALRRRDGRSIKSILVCCGATDPANCTQSVLRAVSGLADDIAITIVLSSRAPHLDAVRQSLRGRMRLLLDVDGDSMAGLMTEADLAVGAPGTTAFERAVLGLPSILVTFADNQQGVSRMMSNAGAAIDAGLLDRDLVGRLQHLLKNVLENGETRKRMANTASALVDGRGALRIMLALHTETDVQASVVGLRLAARDDEAWLLWLQNQPQTRRYFRNPTVPTAAEHHAWMKRTLSDHGSTLLIIEANHEPVGMVRLDRSANPNAGRSFEISVAVEPARHGRGLGSAALRLVRKLMPSAVLDARVHVHNAASKALFRAAGFVELSDELHRSIPA